jgi:hypothetical protein
MSVDMLRHAIESNDEPAYTRLFAPDIHLHTAARYEPVIGRERAAGLLSAVFSVLQGFHYVEQVDGDELHVLHFRARVRDLDLEGVDLLRLDAEGLVREFTVMLRPLEA